MNLVQAANLIREHFTDQASQWTLRPEALRVDYVPSPGGFGPMNFAVHDGRSAYHVKLGRRRNTLSAWIHAAQRLAELYRAPRVLAQVEIGGRRGIVLERLPGKTPANSPPTRVLGEIVSMLGMLHEDGELAHLIGGGSRPARDTVLEYHISMCESDLQEIERAIPPFLDKVTVKWMRDETDALRNAAIHSPAFDEQVSGPIHGDLWFGNVLVDGDRWWIIDWDDLKIGDPAHDLSLILFTALEDAALTPRWLPGRSEAFIERFRLCARAALLTFVIDPLADWIEADSFPGVRDSARAHREALYSWALSRYRKLYGDAIAHY